MSIDYAQIQFVQTGRIFHAQYNTVSDIPGPRLFDTREAMVQGVYGDGVGGLAMCVCDFPGLASRVVQIATCYASEFWWEGRACLMCKVIVDGLEPFDGSVVRNEGLPDWWIGGVMPWEMAKALGL